MKAIVTANRFGLLVLCLTLLSCWPGGAAIAAEYHVSPAGKAANTGAANAPWSLAKANASVRPGDMVLLHAGAYRASIHPARSGLSGKPIVFAAAPGQRPVITGVELAVDFRQRSHVAIRGLTVEKVGRFLWAEQSSDVTIIDCSFDTASSFESCRMRKMGDQVRVLNNVFRHGGDLLNVEGGKHYLIEGNTFDTAGHSCLTLMGVKYSVVRRNHLRNPLQKLMEVFTTRSRRHPEPQILSEYLVIEGNWFDLSAGDVGMSGIQYAGNRSILRRNVFRQSGIGMNWACYRSKADFPEAWHDRSNRFYNNVIYDCGRGGAGAAIDFGVAMPDFGDQVHVNNILYNNRCGEQGAAQSVQVFFGWDARPEQAKFFYNDILHQQPGEPVFGLHPDPPNRDWTLSEYEANYPELAAHNIGQNPLFVDPAAGDFHLQPGSPCIDAGGPLTHTRAAGSGTVLQVDDALFFSDGFGLVEPDTIRVGEERVRVAKVNHAGRRIEVDRAISWNAGEPVALDYVGKAPDIGAFESGAE